MNILIINTAFDCADYIVVKDYEVGKGFENLQYFSEKADSNARHSETSLIFADEALKDAGIEIEDIDVVAVNLGPGSFTGIRIGVALAKGLLCATENMRAVRFDSFEPIIPRLCERCESFAGGCVNGQEMGSCKDCGCDVNGRVCIESGKNDFYVCEVKNGEEFELKTYAYSKEELEKDKNCVIFDNDYKVEELIKCTINKIDNNQFCDMKDLEPVYLKLSQAEIELKRKEIEDDWLD